jgi:predicted nucleic acid-binding protein
MTTSNAPDFVVLDASIVIGLCANEPDKQPKIIAAIDAYRSSGSAFYSAHSLVTEVLYVLCNKKQSGVLDDIAHADALTLFFKTMQKVSLPSGGDVALAKRADEIRAALSCRHSTDSIYLALAEELATQGMTALLTFDEGQAKQAATAVPQITVNLLKP